MNQKDYNEIAKIMKWCPNAFVTKGYKEGLEDGRNNFCKRLADYFEKEDNKQANFGCANESIAEGFKEFNKEQFLKDCGVE